MKKVKRWRYYCDFCKKSGGSGGHMKNHEAACTKNPDRECGLCRMADLEQKKTSELIELVNKHIIWRSFEDNYGNSTDSYTEFKSGITEDKVLKELRDFVEGCPACMLTAMRLTITTGLFSSFKWIKERDSFYKEGLPEPDYSGYY